jgi:uncharacterized protein (DUF433 family)
MLETLVVQQPGRSPVMAGTQTPIWVVLEDALAKVDVEPLAERYRVRPEYIEAALAHCLAQLKSQGGEDHA